MLCRLKKANTRQETHGQQKEETLAVQQVISGRPKSGKTLGHDKANKHKTQARLVRAFLCLFESQWNVLYCYSIR